MGGMSGGKAARAAASTPAKRSAWVAFFAMLAIVCGAFFSQVEAQSFTFSRIVVEGNERVQPGTIAGFVGFGTGQTVSMGELNAAQQRIVNSGLFRSVEVIPQGATLLVRVAEYPTINRINFEGNRRLDNDRLRTVIRSQERRVYSPSAAEADAAAITDLYRQGGRFAAEVRPVIIERSGNRVDLVFEVREGAVVEIERLSFVGNRVFSDSRLRRVLETSQAGLLRAIVMSDTFLEERIALDRQLLADFYLARGYIDFQVLSVTSEIARERDAFFVTFTVREGQRFTFGNTRVLSEIEGVDAADFERLLRVRRGATYSPTVVEANIARMEKLASDRGLGFARVEPRITRNDRDLSLDIDFVLVRGQRVFVERIDISGNATTRDEVIRRQFRIAEGDPFNPREIREAAERIRALGYFSDVDIETRQGSAGDRLIVDVDVEETTTGSLGFGVSYGREAGAGFNITFSETNFLGRGQRLELAITTGTSQRNSTFFFEEPAFLGRDLSASIGAFYTSTEGLGSTYDTRRSGLELGMGFPVSEFGRLNLRYRLTQDTVFGVDAVNSSRLILADDGPGLVTSSIGLGYTLDTRRSLVDPNFGYVFRLNADLAGLGGDRRYLKATALALVEQELPNQEITLRAELEGGALLMQQGNSRVTERFFLNEEMRGFAFNGIGPRDLNANNRDALGGNMFLVGRLEADFPLGLPDEYGLSGGLFMDVGTVWGLNDRAGGPQAGCPVADCTVDDRLHWRAAAGVSLLWDTPIGPLRLNFSRALRKKDYDRPQNFDVTISSRF